MSILWGRKNVRGAIYPPSFRYKKLPPFRLLPVLCSVFMQPGRSAGMHKRGFHLLILYIYTQYAGTNPVLYDTLYILLYNYSLNYTLTNTWAGNMQTMQMLYIVVRPPKTAPNHSISVGLGDLYPHPVNVPTAA